MNPYVDARNLQRLFGRFEHALKRSGHLKKGRADAQADWESFAEALGTDFFEEVASSGKADTLINDPPGKLMADLSWQPARTAPLTNVVQLIVLGVCRVRNSYIHHEKFVSDGDQWERDAKLVHEALSVLRSAQKKALVDLPKARGIP
jgi:hypothetical protein